MVGWPALSVPVYVWSGQYITNMFLSFLNFQCSASLEGFNEVYKQQILRRKAKKRLTLNNQANQDKCLNARPTVLYKIVLNKIQQILTCQL